MTEKRQRSIVVSVRFSPEEFDALAQTSRTLGMFTSTYLREIALLGSPDAFAAAVNQRMKVRDLQSKIDQIKEIVG